MTFTTSLKNSISAYNKNKQLNNNANFITTAKLDLARSSE